MMISNLWITTNESICITIDRCYPTEKMPSGLGDKLLLRLLACKIGFQYTANFPKRAFQFGSRIANGKENGNDVSNRL